MPLISPAQILHQVHPPAGWDGWVPTFSGRGYRPWAEDPGSFSLEDLAYGLAHTFRYGGHSSPAVTVAEHAILVARIIHTLWPSQRLEKAGLFHDASEAILHDIQAPLRRQVWVTLPSGTELSWMESDFRVTMNIAKDYGVEAADLEAPEVRAADILAASFEQRDCPNLRGKDWGLPPIPSEVAFLSIQGWSPIEAMRQYQYELRLVGLNP